MSFQVHGWSCTKARQLQGLVPLSFQVSLSSETNKSRELVGPSNLVEQKGGTIPQSKKMDGSDKQTKNNSTPKK